MAIKEIAGRLPEYNFFLITGRFSRLYPRCEKIGNIEVHRVGLGFSFDKYLLPVFGFLKAKNIVKANMMFSENIILWAMMASYGGIAAMFFKKYNQKIPLLLTLQEGDYFPSKKFGLAGLFFKKIVRHADYIQVISSYLKREAEKAGAKARIEIVPNGADLEKVKNQKAKAKNASQKLKNELNIRADEKIIVTASRLAPKNAVDVIIDAFDILKKKFGVENIKLLIVGDGYLRNDIESRIKNYGLGKQIILVGSLPQEKVYEYLMISDIFVRPSRSEGLGSAFIEAMACGLPVIGTKVGGIPDFLEDRKTGLFAEIDNPEDLAAKIKELLENQSLREEIVKNSLKLVEQNYSWDTIALKIKNIFGKVTKI